MDANVDILTSMDDAFADEAFPENLKPKKPKKKRFRESGGWKCEKKNQV